jgi:hypothetical protein
MNTLQLAAGSIFLALGAAFLISGILYRISIFAGLDNQRLYKDNGIFIFNFLTIWCLALGLYFFYFHVTVKFIQSHTYFQLLLILICIPFSGVYMYGLKHRYASFYLKLETLYYWLAFPIELFKITAFKELSILAYTLFRSIGGLFSLTKAIENFDNRSDKQSNHWFMRLWRLIKEYILNIKK